LIEGDLDVGALHRALENLIDIHEILRTSFQYLPGMTFPLQVISESGRVSLPWIDLSSLAAPRQEAELETLFEKTKQSPFNLESASPLQMRLIALSPSRHMLLICLPALCADATSLATLTDGISRSYAAAIAGQRDDEALMQYADFSEWQNQLLES